MFFQGGSVVIETIISGDKVHGRRLLRLNHPNICINLTIELIFEPFRVMEMVSHIFFIVVLFILYFQYNFFPTRNLVTIYIVYCKLVFFIRFGIYNI